MNKINQNSNLISLASETALKIKQNTQIKCKVCVCSGNLFFPSFLTEGRTTTKRSSHSGPYTVPCPSSHSYPFLSIFFFFSLNHLSHVLPLSLLPLILLTSIHFADHLPISHLFPVFQPPCMISFFLPVESHTFFFQSIVLCLRLKHCFNISFHPSSVCISPMFSVHVSLDKHCMKTDAETLLSYLTAISRLTCISSVILLTLTTLAP